MRSEEQKAIDRDFAEHGCEGCGEYSRCADMSDRFLELLAIVEQIEALEANAAEALQTAMIEVRAELRARGDAETQRRAYPIGATWRKAATVATEILVDHAERYDA